MPEWGVFFFVPVGVGDGICGIVGFVGQEGREGDGEERDVNGF